jgi:hypothetical protein
VTLVDRYILPRSLQEVSQTFVRLEKHSFRVVPLVRIDLRGQGVACTIDGSFPGDPPQR